MENIMPDASTSQIKQFLQIITKDWAVLTCNPLIELRCIGGTGNVTVARFAPDWIDEAVDHAQRMNAAKQNVYVCINPVDGSAKIETGKGARDEHIAAAFYNFADADTDGAMQSILSFAGPKFTMSVKTGTQPFMRGHAYWELEEPCLNLDAWREVQRSIAASLGTDPAVINPSRIMRVAGTVSWPNAKKVEKGYVPELVTMRTEFSADRDPVPFERMMRAFPASATRTTTEAPAIYIDTGKQAMDRAMVEASINAGENWHHNVVRLVASYVSKGLSDSEIHALTDRFTQQGYTVDDTRREVQQAIDGARSKGWAPQPSQVAQLMAAQVPQVAATAPEIATQADDEPTWPTLLSEFDESALPRREWIYGTDYIRSYISVVASAGGIGKTSNAIVEALCICTGKPLLRSEVKQTCNVWVINLEDPRSELQMRTLAAMKYYQLTEAQVRGKLFLDGEDTIQVTLAAEGRDGLQLNDGLVAAMVAKIKENNIGVIIIDPFVSTHLVNENSNASIQAVVALFRKIARDTHSSISLVHHVRKGNGDEATIDSVRGAGSLIGAARAARVMNRISKDDAERVGIDPKEARSVFRIDDGKANLAPPSEEAVYRKMHGVQIDNGEWIGVAIPFDLPDEWKGMSERVVNDMLALIDGGLDGNGEELYSLRPQDKGRWVGRVIADYKWSDPNLVKAPGQVKSILKQWLSNGLIEEVEYRSTAQRKDRKGVMSTGRVGEQN